MTENLIDEIYDIIKEYTDAPDVFIKAIAYWDISATLGKFVTIAESKCKYPRPNLYILLSSIPAVTRRSVLVSIAEDIYRYVWSEFFKDKVDKELVKSLMEHMDEDEAIIEAAREKTEQSIIQQFTSEGIGDEIEISGLDTYAMINTEFGLTLQKTKGGYLSDIPILLSKLYDGLGHKQTLSGRGGKKRIRIIPPGLYFTLLGELQEPWLYFTEKDIDQGFMRRLMLIYVKPNDLKPENWQSPFDSSKPYPTEELKIVAGKIRERMDEIRGVTAIMHPEVRKGLDKISHSAYKQTIVKEGKGACLCDNSLAENMQKIGVLHAIADTTRNLTTEREIMVEQKDYKVTLNFIKDVRRNFGDAIDKIVNPRERERMKVKDITLNKIIDIIKKNGGFITSGELLAKTKLYERDVKPCIETLMERNELWVILVKKPKIKVTIWYTINKTQGNKIVENYNKEGIAIMVDDYKNIEPMKNVIRSKAAESRNKAEVGKLS